MTIAILCPTRERPEQFKRMLKSIKATITNNASHPTVFVYTSISNEDWPAYKASLGAETEQLFLFDNILVNNITMPEGLPTAHKWNVLAEFALHAKNPKFTLFMLAADDMVFSTPCWDEALLNHYNKLENKIYVYALRDSRDEFGTPHPIVTREYIEALGYFLPPIFLHWFVDSWTVEIAKANNCFTHLKDYMLIHEKPSDHGQADETHNRIRRNGWHERDKWVNERCKHYLSLEKSRLKESLA